MTLIPSTTFGAIYGPNRVYCPRPFPGADTWIAPDDPALADLQSFGCMPLLGDMPVLVHRAAVGADFLTLLEEAGLPSKPQLILYDTDDDMVARIRELSESGSVAVCQYAPADDLAGAGRWFVPLDLFRRLNSKGRLADFVPDSRVPPREELSPEAFFALDSPPRLPIVIKGSCPEGPGGGRAVRLCTSLAAWQAAMEFCRSHRRGLDSVVLEDRLDVTENWCAHVSVDESGAVRGLGATRQLVSDEWRFRGSVVDARETVPAAVMALAHCIGRSISEQGYRGLAAFDIVRDREGGLFALDLNCRPNGSTVLLLLAESLTDATSRPLVRFARFAFRRKVADVLPEIRARMGDGNLVPVALFDRALHPAAPECSRIEFLIAADDDESAEATSRELWDLLDALTPVIR